MPGEGGRLMNWSALGPGGCQWGAGRGPVGGGGRSLAGLMSVDDGLVDDGTWHRSWQKRIMVSEGEKAGRGGAAASGGGEPGRSLGDAGEEQRRAVEVSGGDDERWLRCRAAAW